MQTRRGFLHTLAAAMAGAATFDPKSLLWVPKAEPVGPVVLAGETASVAIERQLELNELAMQFARAMGDRLSRHPSMRFREVMYRYAGQVGLPKDLLEVDETGARGFFEPCPARLVVGTPPGPDARILQDAASAMMGCIWRENIDLFAPIGAELRPGEPFSQDCLVGLATDTESGVSVRVIRYQQNASSRFGAQTWMTDFELAGGHWEPARTRRRRDHVEEHLRRKRLRIWGV